MGEHVTPLKRDSVLISYAKEDEAVANYVQNGLNKAGYRASTFTTAVPAGSRWISSIQLTLETADVVVILLSRAALESSWVLYEIAASIASVERSPGKRVIPVALDKGLVPSGVLAQYQWIITSGAPEEVVASVMQALRSEHDGDRTNDRVVVLDTLKDIEQILAVQLNALTEREFRRGRFLRFTLVIGLSASTAAIPAFTLFHLRFDTAITVSVLAALYSLLALLVGYFLGRGSKEVPDDGSRS